MRGPRDPPSPTIGNVTYHSSPLSLNRIVTVYTKYQRTTPLDLLLEDPIDLILVPELGFFPNLACRSRSGREIQRKERTNFDSEEQQTLTEP
jgi:hypothetical protein